MKGKLLFQEKQNLLKGQLILLITVSAISIISVFFVIEDRGLLTILLVLGPLLVLIGSFGFINLEIKIDSNSITIKYPPFVSNQVIQINELKEMYVRKYNAMLEYGGYGFRGMKKNRAYNVSGKYGLQLEFKDGKKLLVGTQKHEELEKVIKDLTQKKKDRVDG